MLAHIRACVPDTRAPPARRKDARAGRSYRGSRLGLTTSRSLASLSPTIRDEREGGSGYKRAPSSIVYRGNFQFSEAKSLHFLPLPFHFSFSSSLHKQ